MKTRINYFMLKAKWLIAAIVVLTSVLSCEFFHDLFNHEPVYVEPDYKEKSDLYTSQIFSDAIIDILDLSLIPNSNLNADVAAVFNTIHSPYMLPGNMSLDPFWYENSIPVSTLIDADTPILSEIAADEQPDAVYKIIYYPGDALVIRNGAVSYKLPDGTDRIENLYNPGQYIHAGEKFSDMVEFNLNGNNLKALALERDKKMPAASRGVRTNNITSDDKLSIYNDYCYAGTILAAKRIIIQGEIKTHGYDIVLVTDEIISVNGPKINTVPPNRPSGKPDQDTYDYGYEGEGYNGGDVLILSRTMDPAPEKIIASGSYGQTVPENNDQQLQQGERGKGGMIRIVTGKGYGRGISMINPGGPSESNEKQEVYWIDLNYHLEPFDAIGTGNPNSLIQTEEIMPANEILLAPMAFAQLVNTLAPRYTDLLLARANTLYNSLTYGDIVNDDLLYENTEQINPKKRNRIAEARHIYNSILFFIEDEISENPEWMNAPGQNPMWADAKLAWVQLQYLDAGYSFPGFRQPLYIYRYPDQINEYLHKMEQSVEYARDEVLNAVKDLAGAIALRQSVQASPEEENDEIVKLELAIQETNDAITARKNTCDDILATIDNLTNELITIEGNASDANSCFTCSYSPPYTPCATSTIFNELAIVGFCAALTPCDAGCVIGFIGKFVEGIVQVVQGVVELYGSQGSDPNGYASLIKGGVQIGTTVDEIAGLTAEAQRYNQLLADLRTNNDGLADGVQNLLTVVYTLRETIEANPGSFQFPAEALAHIQSFEDLLDQISAITEQIRAQRTELISRTLKIGELQLQRGRLIAEKELAENRRIEMANQIQASATSMEEIVAKAEARLDYIVGSSSKIFENHSKVFGLYSGAIAFLYLDPDGGDSRRIWNYITPDKWLELQVSNSDRYLNEIANDLAGNGRLSSVYDIISPVTFRWNPVIDAAGNATYEMSERSTDEIIAALCPAEDCPLTKAAYYDSKWQSLQSTSKMRFMIYPGGDSNFDLLPDADKHYWNLSFYNSEFSPNKDFKKRVYGVRIKLMFDNYQAPEGFELFVTVRHGEIATFQVQNDVFETFFFPKDEHSSIIGNIRASQPSLQLPEVNNNYFEESYSLIIEPLPPSLTGLNGEKLQNNNMFGTSIRGDWEIDLSATTDILLNHFGQAAVDEFWDKLCGIRFEVHYVTL